jgi:hypothetical protein
MARPVNPFPPEPIIWCGKFRLGRKAVVRDSRTFKLAKYLNKAVLPTPPVSVDWTKGTQSWGMMLNDQLGDCTIAGAAHAIQVWTQANESMVTLPDSVIESFYETWDGYRPNDPDSDQGGIELNVLKQWRNGGMDGHKLDAFADADVQDINEVKLAIYLFGGLYIGFDVPNNMDETPGAIWDIAGAGPISGGHCVHVAGYDTNYVYVISWGSVYKMTWAFWLKYVDEAHTLLSFDWIKNSVSPNGFAQAVLEQDLSAI